MTGRDRKNNLKALFSAGPVHPPAPEIKSMGFAESEPAPFEEAPAAYPQAEGGRAASGAVKAMGLSLNAIAREAEEARALRTALEQGERVVLLDPALISASFVSDRLTPDEEDDPDFAALLDSFRDSGQQVPILVRPLEGEETRYQVAYGHRRLKAARRLSLPVKAIIRSLSDEELILAQGKENAERRNLSFIEKALFAKALSARGFSRKVIGEALGGLKKDEMSRLAKVTDHVPENLIHRIGPAPKIGRERWLALADMFENGIGSEPVKAWDETGRKGFASLPSEVRFQRVFARLASRLAPPKPEPTVIAAADGAVLARLDRKEKALKISFAEAPDDALLEALGTFLKARLTARDGGAEK